MKKIALFILFSVLLPLTTAHAQQKNVTMQPYYGSGDLATHMQKEIDDRIANTLAGATTKSLWYTRGSDTGKWEQNPNVFIYSGTRAVNLNGQSPWNSQGKYARSGTLISPRHIIFAKHFPFSASTTIVFIAPDNSVVSRKIEKVEFATSTSIDIGVALLDRDVPESIPFYPIVPSNVWQQYLSTAANADIPIIYLDQEDKVGVQNVKANAFYNNSVNMSHVKGAGKRAEFDEPIIVGDSGNPAFAVVGGQPVLLFTHFDVPFGPNFSTHFNLINFLMSKLGGGYQLSTLDLSRFGTTTVEKYTLTVTKPTGGIVIARGNINCGDNCVSQYDKGVNVSLAANKSSGYTFTSWGGDCSGTQICILTMDKAKTVTAQFTASATTTNTDLDNDGVSIPIDKCPNTPDTLKSQVNRVGCVKPKITKFDIKPVIEDDIRSVPDVELGKNNVAKIKFKQPVALARDAAILDIDANVIINPKSVEIKSSIVPELNKPATITMYGITEKNPRIKRDGVVCDEPQCKIETFTDGVLTFSVSGFSLYEVEETPVVPAPTPAPAGGGGGGGGGGNPVVTVQTPNPNVTTPVSDAELIAKLTAQLNALIAELERLTGKIKFTTNLYRGIRSDEVKKLQTHLIGKGYTVQATGYYGTITETAVKKFQSDNGIPQTGTVGPLTRAALNK